MQPCLRSGLGKQRLQASTVDDPHLMNGLNVHQGKVTYRAVSDALDYDYVPAKEALG